MFDSKAEFITTHPNLTPVAYSSVIICCDTCSLLIISRAENYHVLGQSQKIFTTKIS